MSGPIKKYNNKEINFYKEMSEPVVPYNAKVKDHSKEAAQINTKTFEYPKMPEAIQILQKEYPTIAKGYEQIILEQYELFAKKHLDYGMSNISAGTQLSNTDEIEFALTGLWYRLNDKVNRWKNMIISKRKANNEPLIDTYQDITNYGIIAQLVERGLWKK
jgi:hypothetical protein